MRSMLLSTALIFTALISSGCATLTVDQGCGVDPGCGVDSACASNDCGCRGVRGVGLLGRLRSGGCVDCGTAACSDCQTGMVGMGRGRVGSGMIGGAGCMNGNCGIAGRGIGGRGVLAGGFGRAGGACQSCGMFGGDCNCGLLNNHAPYTPGFNGPSGPETGHYRYPYYTTRAPRDFLMSNPPSIGR